MIERVVSYLLIVIANLVVQLALQSPGFAFAAAVSVTPELVLYANDSFVAPRSLGALIIPIFEKKLGCRVRALASGDGAQLLTRIELDAQRGKSTAQLVVGIDERSWEKAKQWVEPWGDWTPAGYQNLVETSLTLGRGFLPYDYGVFALMMDRQLMAELKLQVPTEGLLSFQELLAPQWRRNIILEDPRTSGPGLAFFLFSLQALKTKREGQEDAWVFWEKFRGQWLTLTPGWSAAYGLFLKKEAPLVWSYITSQAYHQEMADSGKPLRYQAVLFREGQPFQIEGAALMKSGSHSKESKILARKFLEFLISPEVQKMVPKHAWMMPVLKGVELPESYRNLPRPLKLVQTQTDPTEMTKLLSRWKDIVGRSF